MQIIWKSSVIDCHYINHAWPVFARFASLLSCVRPFLHLKICFHHGHCISYFLFIFFSDNENDFVISCPNVIVLANLILPTSFLTRNDVLLTWLVNFTCQGGLTEKITRVGVFFYRDFNAPREPCLGLIQAGWTLNIITSFQDYRSMSMIYLINITFDTTRPLLHMFNTEILSRSHPPKDIYFIVIICSDFTLLSCH